MFRSHSAFRLQLIMGMMMASVCLLAQATAVQAATSPAPSPTPSATPKVTASPRPAGSPDSTDSSDPDSTQSAETAQLKEHLKQTLDKVLGAINDPKQIRRGFIGEVQRVSAETITLKTTKGTQILAITNQVALSKKGKSITVDDIAVGDWAMVIGQTTDDTFQPEIIEVSSTTLRPKNHLVAIGTITDVAKTTLNFMPKGQTEDTKLSITKNSDFEDADGNALVFKTLIKQTQVLLLGQQTDTGWEVTLVKLLGATGQ